MRVDLVLLALLELLGAPNGQSVGILYNPELQLGQLTLCKFLLGETVNEFLCLLELVHRVGGLFVLDLCLELRHALSVAYVMRALKNLLTVVSQHM